MSVVGEAEADEVVWTHVVDYLELEFQGQVEDAVG